MINSEPTSIVMARILGSFPAFKRAVYDKFTAYPAILFAAHNLSLVFLNSNQHRNLADPFGVGKVYRWGLGGGPEVLKGGVGRAGCTEYS